MSDYNPTYTTQRRDYEAHRKAMEKYRVKAVTMQEEGVPLWERIKVKMPTAPIITEVRPNPLSMELRIALGYFWKGFERVQGRIDEWRAAGRPVPPDLKVERQSYLDDVDNLCYDLFAVTSCFHPFHIHSEYGCNDDTCPAWARGYEAAKEDVHDWYTPDC